MSRRLAIDRRLVLLGLMASLLSGCVTNSNPNLLDPPPYPILPVDESMSCTAIAASFRFAAKRAARLEYWLSVGPLAGYGYEQFPNDAPKQLVDERRRLDALSDLQRIKGCTVMEPGPAVVEERLKLEQSIPPRASPPVLLNSRG